ncbi:flagellar biosynthesis protein FlgL [Duganella sp. Leaf126]|uniref:flagellar hook-associated protein FlgL n=1 Tax=Duganella sp. Leaf126 TaxID=1736266 RepID=UPI0006F62BE3|nr:flagellar hook-associated protein FlgL [Duganella sp. Leaf126]KQQ36136.1 flagellar biosynthesis protein FlgL [Duganella sp. Leaf126]
MRIASSQYQATMLRGLGENQGAINKLNEQMASGNRILLPSDDPVGNVQISRLTREQALVTQYRDNIASVQIRMSTNESYLSSMTRDITDASDLLVWAADGSNAPSDLNAMVVSLTSLRDSLVNTANQRDAEGRYVFSGTEVDKAPIALVGGSYVYQGNEKNQSTVVGNGVTQTTNVNLKGLEDLLNNLSTAITALSDPSVQPNSAALRTIVGNAMDATKTGLNMVSGKIAQLGGGQNILKTLDDNHANVSLSNSTAILDLSQLDYAGAATELAGYNLAVEASYKAYSKVSGMSLFSLI